MPGADAPAAKICALRATVTPETPGISAQWFTAASCSPRRSGSFATVARGTDRKLDTSVEVSGPHDLAVRKQATPVSRAAASTASRPDVLSPSPERIRTLTRGAGNDLIYGAEISRRVRGLAA
jgi:hypothetical protein